MPRLPVLLILLPITLLAADRVTAPLPPEQAARRKMKLPEGFRSTLSRQLNRMSCSRSLSPSTTTHQPVAGRGSGSRTTANGKRPARIRIVIHSKIPMATCRADECSADSSSTKASTTSPASKSGSAAPGSCRRRAFTSSLIAMATNKPDDGPPEVVSSTASATRRANTISRMASRWGPDGWLYGGHGRTSPSDVGKPGTPADQRIHCDGGVYGIHPTKRIALRRLPGRRL